MTPRRIFVSHSHRDHKIAATVFTHLQVLSQFFPVEIQKRVLVENAVQLLRQVWERRAELFDPKDVEAGLQFHLVCASDYSGCRCEVRFPAADSLLQQLRLRLTHEPDRAFADRIVLPSCDGAEATRPWGLAGYFSACHLPEMIADYYEHVCGLERSSSHRQRHRRTA